MATDTTGGAEFKLLLKRAVNYFHEAAVREADIGSPQGYTRKTLAAALDRDVRTVDRILRALKDDGAGIEAHRRPGGGHELVYRMTRPPRWDRRITGNTRVALRLAAHALSGTGTGQWSSFLEALEGLAEEEMTSADRKVFERLNRAIRFRGGIQDPVEAFDTGMVMEPLLRALEESLQVVLHYQAPGFSQSAPVEVVPYALVHDLFPGSAYLVAWNLGRGRPHSYRINRIDGIKVGRRYALSQEAKEALERWTTYSIGGWSERDQPFEITVRVQGRHWVRALLDAPPDLPDYSAVKEGDALRITFAATSSMGVLRWILQFGAMAELLSPEWVRRELADELAKMTALY